MKEWCVVQYKSKNMVDVRYGDRRNDGTQGVYRATWITKAMEDLFENPTASTQQVFFVDTELEADRLMMHLSGANPGIEYGKARVLVVAHATAAPPVLARYTERGLMPV